jgi:peptide/nickel transport system substrate-binding protein
MLKHKNTTKHKTLRGYFYWFVCIVALLMSLGSSLAAAAQEEEFRRGGELHVALPIKPIHLNPAIQSGTFTGIPGSQIFASLLRVDRKWNYHPYLAEQWKIAEDGLSYTFHLRRGATFHDGKPITSEDVAFSILAVKKYHPFSSMLAVDMRIETPTPYTVVVHLKQPHPVLLLVAASPMLPIIPKHIFGNVRNLKTHPANWKPVGSGPFQFVEFNDQKIVMERYKDFFLPGKPYLDRVVFKIMGERTSQVAFETGLVHLQGFNGNLTATTKLAALKHIKIDYDGYAGVGPTRLLLFNLEKSPFDDLRVRQAIAYSIDRKFLAETILKGRVPALTGPIYPGTQFYWDDVQRYDIDIERANKLLDEAGYSRDAKGVRFSTTCDAGADAGGSYLETLEYLRMELLRNIGVNIRFFYNKSFSDYAKRLSNREYALAFVSYFNWGDPVIGVHRIYSSKNIRKGVMFSNMTGYRNTRVDSLMEQAEVEVNVKKRKALYAEFQRIVAREIPAYSVMALSFATIYHQRLGGLNSSIWGTMFPYDEVYFKK